MGDKTFLVGLDLGQKGDYTAIAVVEHWMEFRHGVDLVTYQRMQAERLDVRHLDRIPLGTSYTAIVERVSDMMRSAELRKRSVLLVDATGVGAPVVDMLRRAPLDSPVMGVTITGGNHAVRRRDGWRVPKRDLVTCLQVALEEGMLRMPAELAMGRELAGELTGMRVRFTGRGHDTYGAGRSGSHDDLVLALGLACWGKRFG
jgi:hypothetical protein